MHRVTFTVSTEYAFWVPDMPCQYSSLFCLPPAHNTQWIEERGRRCVCVCVRVCTQMNIATKFTFYKFYTHCQNNTLYKYITLHIEPNQVLTYYKIAGFKTWCTNSLRMAKHVTVIKHYASISQAFFPWRKPCPRKRGEKKKYIYIYIIN
jgi:hypothetical protein